MLIKARATDGRWTISVITKEPISAVALRLNGEATDQVGAFETALIDSGVQDGKEWNYTAEYTGSPRRGVLQVSVQTEAAKVRSMTIALGEK